MLDTSKALEGSVDHDGEPCAQCLTLLHTVRRQNNASPFLYDASQDVPEVASGGWVHASGRLIQQDNGGIANKSYGCTQLAFVPTTAVSWSVSV